jgi:hypothetical protein
MRRDWPLVASGFGIAVLGASLAFVAILAYGPADDAPCPRPKPPAVRVYGCYRRPGGFDYWIGRPGVVIFLAIALVLLVVAVVTIVWGWRREAPRPAGRLRGSGV